MVAAPCDWPVQQCGPLPSIDDEAYDPLLSAARGVLWALSGRQFGCCEVTVRPCREACLPAGWVKDAIWPAAALSAGEWVNISCRTCGDRCSCSHVSELRMPGPVCAITDVVVDGVSVSGAARVDDSEWLVRTDGGEWPLCQEMSLPAGEEGTWYVIFTRGVPVPDAGQRALGELMSELWKACNNQPCGLPKRVQTVTKGGITFAMLDPMEFLQNGKTGLYFTDLWLQSVNPLARPSGAQIISPDMPRHRTQTWPL